MNMTQLRYFLKTAELLNYSRAADELLVARQSLRQAIAALEEEIGRPLFFRERNHLSLTEYGTYLSIAGQEALRAFDAAQEGLTRLIQRSSELRIGFSVSLSPFILPNTDNILRAFRSRFADIRLTVEQMENDVVIEAVMEGRLDVGCVIQIPQERSGCRMYRLEEYEIALDYSDPQTFGGRRHVGLEALDGVSCLGMGRMDVTLRPLWEACRERKIRIPYQVVPDTLDAFYQMKHGQVVGFDVLKTNVPEFSWDRTSVLDGFRWEVGFLCASAYPDPNLMTLFCRFMEEEYRVRRETYDREFGRSAEGFDQAREKGLTQK